VALAAVDRAKELARWSAARTPVTYLLAGWIVFVLGSYPGYLSTDAILQLYTVRSGDYSDYAPVMTAIWGALEYVISGPFPMLALQSGLFLFGLFAILRTVLAPRVAAVTAVLVLLFPPVFALMAVIWPEALLAGALLGAVGASLQDGWRWRAIAIVLLVIACACRGEAVVAIIPLVLHAVPSMQWWRRAGITLAICLGVAGTARLADRLLTVTDTYVWEHGLQMMDTVGTLRRAKVQDEAKLRAALDGIPLADPPTLRERMIGNSDALSWRPLVHGEKRMFEAIDSDEEADAVSAAWWRVIASHPGAYLHHRWSMARAVLAIRGKWRPVFDDLGSHDLLAPLHHRATTSDWQYGMQHVVRAVAATPLFRPWLYLVLAIAAIVLARKQPLLRALAISGLVFQVAVLFFATSTEYRHSHWMVTATCVALAAIAVSRREAWRARPT
jgi:hypothetical protein